MLVQSEAGLGRKTAGEGLGKIPVPIGAEFAAVPGHVEMAFAILHHGNCAVAGAEILGDTLRSGFQQVGIHECGQPEALLPIRHIISDAIDDNAWRLGRRVAVYCQSVTGARIDAIIARVEPLSLRCAGTGFCWQTAGDIPLIATVVRRRIAPGSAVADMIVEVEVIDFVRCPWAVDRVDKPRCRATRRLGTGAWGELGGARH